MRERYLYFWFGNKFVFSVFVGFCNVEIFFVIFVYLFFENYWIDLRRNIVESVVF